MRRAPALVLRVGHELRNVLNHLALVATEYEMEEGSAAATQMRERLAGSTGHMTELLDELQEMSALSAGRTQVRVTRFSPERLLRELAAIHRPQAEAKGLELSFKADPKLAEVQGDERKTYQVLANLVSNAIKYTERGEICLEAHLLDGRWAVSVRDTGVGIAPEEHASIFSEFHRVERTAGEQGPRARAVDCGLAAGVAERRDRAGKRARPGEPVHRDAAGGF
jgi:signal transduction histidine kinase